MRTLIRDLLTVVFFLAALFALNIALHFPYTTDGPHEKSELVEADAEEFYESAYEPTTGGEDSEYVETARSFAHGLGIEEWLNEFIQANGLEGARALEVGAGSGTLQDIVEDYTGLDIAASAAPYFHKPFVHGSATDLPFPDNSFDLVWTIWTLEHVINPERALFEMRRVVKDGGYLYVNPSWNCETWGPEGYSVRNYEDLDLPGKIAKASLNLREQGLFKASYLIPMRYLRWAATSVAGPSRLRYRAIDANFENFWVRDGDAVNSTDCFEARLWFETRGDTVLNPETLSEAAWLPCDGAITVQVHKSPPPSN